jgi:hypothetical protein
MPCFDMALLLNVMNLQKLQNVKKPYQSHFINFHVLNLLINQYKLKLNNRNTSYNINTFIVALVTAPYTF